VTTVDKATIIGALAETWRSIASLGETLMPDEWSAPTDCPGWAVRDQLAHMTGTELTLTGESVPDIDVHGRPYIRNEIGRRNEQWIEGHRAMPPSQVLAAFTAVTKARLEQLACMTQAEFDAEAMTPAGRDTYGRLMQIRTMDCWMHEQDMRYAIGRPGHEEGAAVKASIDEVVLALGYIIGKQVGAQQGSGVRFELTGPMARLVDVVVDGRAQVVDGFDGLPTTTVTLPVPLFLRLAGGRVDPSDELASGAIDIAGDGDLGERVVRGLPYMI
jgi:uncharacterized protein (TIGR03083 family)